MTRLPMAAILLAAIVLSAPALARETGLDRLHAQARVGGKICMTEHEHYGEGWMTSRAGAVREAMGRWSAFTAWEYGTPWGSYRAAVGKKMGCSRSGDQWVCKTTARPCRPAR